MYLITIIIMDETSTSLFPATSAKHRPPSHRHRILKLANSAPPCRGTFNLPPICPTIYSTCARPRTSSLSLHPFHAARSTSPRTDIFITRNRSLTRSLSPSPILPATPDEDERTNEQKSRERDRAKRDV